MSGIETRPGRGRRSNDWENQLSVFSGRGERKKFEGMLRKVSEVVAAKSHDPKAIYSYLRARAAGLTTTEAAETSGVPVGSTGGVEKRAKQAFWKLQTGEL